MTGKAEQKSFGTPDETRAWLSRYGTINRSCGAAAG
jgi:hypothetical protein